MYSSQKRTDERQLEAATGHLNILQPCETNRKQLKRKCDSGGTISHVQTVSCHDASSDDLENSAAKHSIYKGSASSRNKP